jgi:Ca-activated chloride channel family protein
LVLAGIPTRAQYFIRGEIKDETQKSLANVKMIFHSTGYIYYSGTWWLHNLLKCFDTATLGLKVTIKTIVLDVEENSLVLKMLAKGK